MTDAPLNAAIGYCRRGMTTGKFMESLIRLLQVVPSPEHLGGRVLPVECQIYLHPARNQLVQALLRMFPDQERFLLLDDDIVFQPWHAAAVLSRCTPEQPVVSGLYAAWDGRRSFWHDDLATGVVGHARPVLLRKRNGYQGDTRCVPVWDYPEDELIEVDVIGMGFVAVHRTLLEQLGPRQFDDFKHDNGDAMPEDASWCNRVQAAGHKLIVHTGVKLGHMKLVQVVPPAPRGAPAGNDQCSMTNDQCRGAAVAAVGGAA